MSQLKILVHYADSKQKNGSPDEILDLESTDPVTEIDPAALLALRPSMAGKQISMVDINVNFDAHQILIVRDFEDLNLRRFHNSSPQLAFVRIMNIRGFARVNGLNIRRLDIESASVMVNDSIIRSVYYNIQTMSDCRRLKTPIPDTGWMRFSESEIRNLKVFSPLRKLEIINSEFVGLNFSADVRKVHVQQSSSIDRLEFRQKINTLALKDSHISTLSATPRSLLFEVKLQESTIKKTFGLTIQNTGFQDFDMLNLLRNSYKQSQNFTQYSQVSYELFRQIHAKETNTFIRLVSWLLKVSCGYGYRPIRLLYLSFSTIVFSTIFLLIPKNLAPLEFGLEPITGKFSSGNEMVLKAVLYSFESFIGLSSTVVKPTSFLISIIPPIEAGIGLFVFSILIYSFSKRLSD